MLGAVIPFLGALGGPAAQRILGPGFLDPGVIFTRAHTPGTARATRRLADGALAELAQNQARFSGAAQRLLVAGARTNGIRNPRAEGAAAGTPGTMPANWPMPTSNAGTLARQVIGTGTEGGVPYLDVRFTMSATASGNIFIGFEATTQVAASAGQSWTGSFFATLLAGSLPGQAQCVLAERDAAGAGLAGAETPVGIAIAAGSLPASRFSATRVLANPAVARITVQLRIAVPNGAAVDFTLRLGAPQLEEGGFASLPILPPAGSPQAATLAAELPLWLPAAGIPASGTVLLRAMLPQAAGGAAQGLMQLDAGNDANRMLLRNQPGGTELVALVETGSVLRATLAPSGNIVPGTPFRAAFAWSPAGLSFCFTGSSLATAAATTPAVSRLRIGHATSALTAAAFGEVETLDHVAWRMSDAALLAAVA